MSAACNRLDFDQVTRTVGSAIAMLHALPGCSGKVGAVGFCLDGKRAFLTATRTDVDAAASYYGVDPERSLNEGDRAAGPIMLHIASADERTVAFIRRWLTSTP